MNIESIIQNGTNVQLVINALELKEAFMQWAEVQKQNVITAETEKYLTADEVATRLQVDKSSLWRWNKTGYLTTIKIGNKVRYRESDINKILEG